MKKKILVVFGGKSVEHDISIITAFQVIKNMPKSFDFLPVYIDKFDLWWTAENLNEISTYADFDICARHKKQVSLMCGKNILMIYKHKKFIPFCEVDCVINCCHGGGGENGSLQGLFEMCHIPQTSSGACSCAQCMDKILMKKVLHSSDILSPKYVDFCKCEYEDDKAKCFDIVSKNLSLPVIVKPSSLGSSIGISVCESVEDFDNAFSLAFSFGEKILVEEVVQNLLEFNCAGLLYKGNVTTSKVGVVKKHKNIYTFDEKYLKKSEKIQFLTKDIEKSVKKLTEKTYKLFDCRGIVRVDFLFNEKENLLFVNEINSIPGSFSFYLFEKLPFSEMLRAMVEEAKANYEKSKSFITDFESDALDIFTENCERIKK